MAIITDFLLVKVAFFVLISGDVISGAMKPVSSMRNSVTDFVAETSANRISASEAEEVVGNLGEIADVIREGTQAVISAAFFTFSVSNFVIVVDVYQSVLRLRFT